MDKREEVPLSERVTYPEAERLLLSAMVESVNGDARMVQHWTALYRAARDTYADSRVQAALAPLRKELDEYQTLYYDAEETLCSCNRVDETQPVGSDMNYICEWHQEHPRDEKPLFTLANRAEAAESALRDMERQRDELRTFLTRELKVVDGLADKLEAAEQQLAELKKQYNVKE